MKLAPRFEELLGELMLIEGSMDTQRAMLDHTFDLHNDLTDWAVNTGHSEAADEVLAILERYARPKYRGVNIEPGHQITLPLPEGSTRG